MAWRSNDSEVRGIGVRLNYLNVRLYYLGVGA